MADVPKPMNQASPKHHGPDEFNPLKRNPRSSRMAELVKNLSDHKNHLGKMQHNFPFFSFV